MTFPFDRALPGVLELQPYQPGKPPEELERELGISGAVKLASNENPLGPSPLAVDAMKIAAEEAHIYPDGGGYKLRTAIAANTGRLPDDLAMVDMLSQLESMDRPLGDGRRRVRVVQGAARERVSRLRAGTVSPVAKSGEDHRLRGGRGRQRAVAMKSEENHLTPGGIRAPGPS